MFGMLFKKKVKRKRTPGVGINDCSKFDSENFWYKREFEFKHQDPNTKFRTSNNQQLKFGEVINTLFEIRKEEVTLLTINNGTLTNIEGQDNIWNFEFLQHYYKEESNTAKGCSGLENQVVLTLAYKTAVNTESDKDKSLYKKNSILILHLQNPEGVKDNVMYVQGTFCLPNTMRERHAKGLNPNAEVLTILFGIDYRPVAEINKDYLRVYKSALKKHRNNKIYELNDAEIDILDAIDGKQADIEYYTAKRAMLENRYLDAIMFYKNAYKGWQQKWWDDDINVREFQALVDSSFSIGYCYYELGLYDKALKYLEFSFSNGRRGLKFLSEYINCLIALNDVRSIVIINKLLDNLTEDEETPKTEEEMTLIMFLMRKKIFCLIEIKQFKEAEDIIKLILTKDPENTYVKEELEHIKKLKKTVKQKY